MLVAQSIQLGLNDIVVAGGMESISNVPKYLARYVMRQFHCCFIIFKSLFFPLIYVTRRGSRLSHDIVVDGMMKDGLWDAYNDFGMRVCGEICADQYRVTREEHVTHLHP